MLERQKSYYVNLSKEDKEIRLKKVAEWQAEHPEKVKIYKKNNAPKQKIYYEKWYRENGRNRTDNDREKVYEWAKAYPDRIKIMSQLNYAVKSGKIKRPGICSKCSRKTRVQAHHYNYAHYMNLVWLCVSCHKNEHIK